MRLYDMAKRMGALAEDLNPYNDRERRALSTPNADTVMPVSSADTQPANSPANKPANSDPVSSDDKRKAYQRELMRKRRADAKRVP